MRIALDVDGVLYEWDKTARYMLRTMLPGYERELNVPSEHWNWIQERVRPEDWEWLWQDGVEHGLFRYGHLVQGAIEGVRALAEEHDVLIVTHRPRGAVRDTVDWLSFNRFPVSEVYLLTQHEPKSMVNADILIDDKPDNIHEWQEAGGRGLLFARPWNQYEEIGAEVATGWPHCVKKCKEMLDEQRELRDKGQWPEGSLR